MTQAIHKLLVANRGEIAVRIIRAAKALGIPTVAACSEADVDSQAARMADEIHVLGPARADKSYLNVEALLGALKATGANAVHSGYGFLSENADTPKLTLGHGGCFGCIYSVRGAGGYQMFGVTPAPIYDPQQTLAYLKEHMVFFRPGDIVQFKPMDREAYDHAVAEVEAGCFDLRIRPVEFSLDAFLADPVGYPKSLQEVLA